MGSTCRLYQGTFVLQIYAFVSSESTFPFSWGEGQLLVPSLLQANLLPACNPARTAGFTSTAEWMPQLALNSPTGHLHVFVEPGPFSLPVQPLSPILQDNRPWPSPTSLLCLDSSEPKALGLTLKTVVTCLEIKERSRDATAPSPEGCAIIKFTKFIQQESGSGMLTPPYTETHPKCTVVNA